MPTMLAGMTTIDQNRIFISTGNALVNSLINYWRLNIFVIGKAFNFYTTQASVLKIVPGSRESIESSNLQWITNYEVYDSPNHSSGLSSGAVAGIVISVLVFIFIIIVLLWKYVPVTRNIAKYIQQDLIWNPRYLK